jgi:hypothetical protein
MLTRRSLSARLTPFQQTTFGQYKPTTINKVDVVSYLLPCCKESLRSHGAPVLLQHLCDRASERRRQHGDKH